MTKISATPSRMEKEIKKRLAVLTEAIEVMRPEDREIAYEVALHRISTAIDSAQKYLTDEYALYLDSKQTTEEKK